MCRGNGEQTSAIKPQQGSTVPLRAPSVSSTTPGAESGLPLSPSPFPRLPLSTTNLSCEPPFPTSILNPFDLRTSLSSGLAASSCRRFSSAAVSKLGGHPKLLNFVRVKVHTRASIALISEIVRAFFSFACASLPLAPEGMPDPPGVRSAQTTNSYTKDCSRRKIIHTVEV